MLPDCVDVHMHTPVRVHTETRVHTHTPLAVDGRPLEQLASDLWSAPASRFRWAVHLLLCLSWPSARQGHKLIM